MTVYAITDTKKGRTGIAPTYLQTTQNKQQIHKQTNNIYKIIRMLLVADAVVK